MITNLKLWWHKRRLDRAQALVEIYGLSVVKLRTVAGATYIQHADGELLRLVKVPRGTTAQAEKVVPFQKSRGERVMG